MAGPVLVRCYRCGLDVELGALRRIPEHPDRDGCWCPAAGVLLSAAVSVVELERLALERLAREVRVVDLKIFERGRGERGAPRELISHPGLQNSHFRTHRRYTRRRCAPKPVEDARSRPSLPAGRRPPAPLPTFEPESKKFVEDAKKKSRRRCEKPFKPVEDGAAMTKNTNAITEATGRAAKLSRELKALRKYVELGGEEKIEIAIRSTRRYALDLDMFVEDALFQARESIEPK